MPYRSIQPASQDGGGLSPARDSPAAAGGAGAGAGGAAGGGKADPIPRKRANITRQACASCRKSKSKCDGEQPTCSHCRSKGLLCSYDPAPPGTSLLKKKTRLATLETLLSSLMNTSDHDANSILSQIRTVRDLDALMESGLTEDLSPILRQSRSPSRTHPSPTAPPIALPGLDVIKIAIRAFFDCSAKLFHVFSADQLDYHYRSMSSSEGPPSKISVCVVSAVAAVGLQYLHSVVDDGFRTALYQNARMHLEDVVEESPLDTIKICSVLAMFNVMDKATISLAYIDIGLCLSRRLGLRSTHRHSSVPGHAWPEYRRAWRSLMVFTSWLASTLGYISGVDAISLNVPVDELFVDTSTDFIDVVQAQMAKIIFLNAEVLRACLAFEDSGLKTTETIIRDLHEWYVMLPSDMHLSALGREGIPVAARRSICQIHLFYLGALMLLYRRVSAKCVKKLRLHGGDDGSWTPSGTFRRILREGAVAAKHSSRILSLLLDEEEVIQRCWITIFQAYTSGTILLYYVAQRQLYNHHPSEWAEDMLQAENCLRILSYCGSVDPVARKFYDILMEPYEVLRDHVVKEGSITNRSDLISIKPDQSRPPDETDQFADHLHMIPFNGSPRHISVSLSLLVLVCRPFDDPGDNHNDLHTLASDLGTEKTSFEYVQAIERLDWAFGEGVQFQWSLNEQGCKSLHGKITRDRGVFLGSSRPSGWQS